jgi:hypothetical protein
LWAGGTQGNLRGQQDTDLVALYDLTTRPNKIRKIQLPVYGLGGVTFDNVAIDPQYNVWTTMNVNQYKLHIEGDSFAEGANPSGNCHPFLHTRLGAHLGCDNITMGASGTTGFINNTGSGQNFVDRINQYVIPVIKPDILFFPECNWDAGFTSAQRQAAYDGVINSCLASNPNMIILIAGDRVINSQVSLDVQASVARANNRNVQYIDIFNGATAIGHTYGVNSAYTGTVGKALWTGNGLCGDSSSTVAGNTQWYQGATIGDAEGHPNIRGLEQQARFWTDAIVAAMANTN